ncbi:MAG: SGNH/GDSL hydrolase family protein [Caulobacteraceae bacterium]|nr:SGNH/GDSL hydrolase family protein [Caulobacteraceae bacterium]
MRAITTLFAVLLTLAACSPRDNPPQPRRDGDWAESWMTSPQPPREAPMDLADQTVRQVVRVGLGARRARIRISNTFGRGVLELGAAHLALSDGGARIQAGSDRPLTFGGRPGLTLAVGESRLSDPVDLDIAPLGHLTVSLYVKAARGASEHSMGLSTAYLVSGNAVGAADLPGASRTTRRLLLSGVEAPAPARARVVVALGDSITDGKGSDPDAEHRWIDRLADRLTARTGGRPVALLNAGIAGNRLLHEGIGPSALARFDRDVLGQAGVSDLILFEGINDIGLPALIGRLDQRVGPQDLIGAYQGLIRRAHARGLRVIGVTLAPCGPNPESPGYASPRNAALRQAVNQWIRTSGAFDAVIDADAALRDPADPGRLRPAYDSGDHLHPNQAGYEALAQAVDLRIFD